MVHFWVKQSTIDHNASKKKKKKNFRLQELSNKFH